ncbi:helix-turn-helix domain-containing protein [Halomicroarcula sp. F13]|uniref:Helix-turn-helix domain-containing protein n=1 Tax=Haloarcula rubra TaxID=2487747 RepID=A0AAW4PNU0_9EURY|nr:helix-turn-helix domain-containing protein [Halomicroarcula rubra]MBX0322841.1 helix-turn-helix domain-containing protein [Halomicroarcula rubra]
MIVEFHVETGFLRDVGRSADDGVTMQHLQCTEDGCRAVVWVGTDEKSSVDATLVRDDSVARAVHVGPEAGGHWYVVHTTNAPLNTVGDGLLRTDGVFVRSTFDDDGWAVRGRFPDRSAVLTFREHVVAENLDVDVRSMVEDDADEATETFGVTGPQREVLLLALESGYFTVPRDASLSDLASVLDISSQAASERLRRGTGTLVEQTLAAPDRHQLGLPNN